jgi:cysteinyl-tRNA synthetase, unknown class
MPRPSSFSGTSRLSLLAALTVPTLLVANPAPSISGAAADVHTGNALVLAQLSAKELVSAERRQRMNAIQNWGYWLSSFAIEGVVAAPHDLLVIDHGVSANRRFQRERGADEMARMKRRPDGSPRILLSYLSIGEAERYRPYWQPEWYDLAKKPIWLGAENPDWPGNFRVEYWHPDWQQLIFGTPDSYVDRIIRQGFDGIYIDRADAFLLWEGTRATAREDMAAFVVRLAAYAHQQNPSFVIVMQNAEELLEIGGVMDALDAIAKEDLLYGIDKPEQANKPADVKWSLKFLQKAQRAGRKILVVEYLSNPTRMVHAARRILDEGFVPYFAPRALDCLNPPAVLSEGGRLPEHPCR